jgi:5'-deoxynucleotidase YfbR-like HD superfamily hydrolase
MTNKLKKIEASLTASASALVSLTISTRAPADVTKQVHEVRSMLAALNHDED